MTSLEDPRYLTRERRLLLHQLRLYEWMHAQKNKEPPPVVLQQLNADDEDASIPRHWELTKGVHLYSWQEECVARWFKQGYQGTAKVVTGGGKTILGLAIAQKLQNDVNSRLRVAVVVPTVVLMHQWYDELIDKGNLPAHAVGRLGGGYSDDFTNRRVLVAVLASAHKQLPLLVRRGRNSKRLLLIADECHRAGAAMMSKVFETQRPYSLGLSATPERDEDEGGEPDAGYDDSLLGKELGPIIYDFNLSQALKLGVVPRFTIRHYGIPLTPEERSRYASLSRSISERQSELRALAPLDRTSGGSFFSWARSIAGQAGKVGDLASGLNADISRRKELIHRAAARGDAVEALLRCEFSQNMETRAILFHESIDEVMKLFVRLQEAGFSVVAEHSRLPGGTREEGLELFRKGVARVIVSARSLIEGFNVPAVDVGIIVASSGSVRQRIQSLGRVLRRHRTLEGEEKTSAVHVLYVRDTVDDRIYGKSDWDRTTGVAQNFYFEWDPPGKPQQREGPPRSPLPGEMEIDPSQLCEGEEYPGRYEGVELTCDTQGNVRDHSGAYASNPGELADEVQRVKGSAGRFRITSRHGYVLVRVPRDDDWITLFVGRQTETLKFGGESDEPTGGSLDVQDWVGAASPGDEYPFVGVPVENDRIVFRQKRGGVLALRVKNREVFARAADTADDPAKGVAATHLLAALRELRQRGKRVSRLEINVLRHVLFRERGRAIFVCALAADLEFPPMEP